MQEEDVVGKVYDARLVRRLSAYVRPYGWLVASALACLMLDGLLQLVGRLMTRMTSDVEALNELFTAGVVAGLGDLFTLLAISVIMVVTDWRLALASFGVIPFVYWASYVFRAKVRESYRDIRARMARI